MGGIAAFSVAVLPSCGDKKEGAKGETPAAEEAKPDKAAAPAEAATAVAAKNETVSITLTGLR